MLDILSIGDCTIDVFLTVKEGSIQCNLNKEYCEICFNYGDKIPVDEVVQIPGTGNAANLAIGSSRLGLKSAISTIVGDEGTGELILKNFAKEKVSRQYLIYDKKEPTNYSAVINYKGERTIFSHHEPRKYIFPKIKQTPKWIYLTSVGLNYEKLYSDAVKYCQKNNVKLGFNPGTLQVREGTNNIKKVIRQTNVLIVNKEEAQMILGINKSIEIKNLLTKLHNLGAKIVVITDGENGAYNYDGNSYLFCPTLGTKVVERTGAGDAFSTGFIASLIHGNNCQESLKWGTLNSDSVIRYVGPHEKWVAIPPANEKPLEKKSSQCQKNLVTKKWK